MIRKDALYQRIQAINQQLMYCHSMTIWQQDRVIQPDKSSKLVWMVRKKDIPCKLSKKDLDKGSDIKEDVNPINEAFTVFCAPDVYVKAGDLLEVDGIKYRAGNPFKYPTHQEIHVARSDLA